MSDIGLIAQWTMLREVNRIRGAEAKCDVEALSPEAVRLLEKQDWPGNVRELQNVILRTVALAEVEIIQPEHVLLTPRKPEGQQPAAAGPAGGGMFTYAHFKATVLDVLERGYLQQLLAFTNGNVTKAAEVADLARSHLRSMLKRYGM